MKLRRIDLPLALLFATAPAAAAFQGADVCAQAQPLVGQSTFVVDTRNATTGSEGQGGSLPCIGGSPAGITNDVWFWWAAAADGEVELSTCGGPGFDTKIQVYSGAGCPTAGAITCADDDCQDRAIARFYARAGQLYTFQIGSKPGATGGIVTGTISTSTPDHCESPIAIEGIGTFPFDNTQATNSQAGQFESACDQFGTTSIGNDVWYRWTAPSSGNASLTTCNLTAVDTKIAVYPLAGPFALTCPTSAAIACNDDACGYQSTLSFACVENAEYVIQVGTYATSPGGTGAFRISIEGSGCGPDDGHAEGSWGNPNAGSTVWMQRFGSPGETTVLSSVSVAYGQTVTPGFAPPNGTPVTIAVWDDPDDDGHPGNAKLVRSQVSVMDNVDTDLFNLTNLVPPVTVRGVYFVGVHAVHGDDQYAVPLDMQGNSPAWTCWMYSSAFTSLDLSNLAPFGQFVDLSATWGGVRSLMVRAACEPATGIYDYCHSSVTGYSCAAIGLGCANGLPGRGCANSANGNGAMLSATGSAAILSDSVKFTATGLPPLSSTLFLQSTTSGPGPTSFGDGLRCAGGTIIRLATKSASALGNAQFGYGVGSDPSVHARGLVTAPGVRYYQAWYRNAASFCTSSTFNLTNGVAIEWN